MNDEWNFCLLYNVRAYPCTRNWSVHPTLKARHRPPPIHTNTNIKEQ